ncbi:serine hydrolase [uncultured Albimonas sp.]|uniref:serine hydrolase domain-containing protein n=1 Tax=uncultured Albimonas sp. TaxID=1331701 RepID=UPI0030EE2725|tara:strand:+ start:1386 stop:2378 length:993 start_codon:yes stop_codon:yes gene_type:complete
MEHRLAEAHAAGELAGLHGVLVLKDGEIFAEAYFPGQDEAWGEDLGRVEHGPDTLHDLRSVTKSVVGLLYGVALAEGRVPPLDAPLVEAFPEYPDLAQDPARRGILIRHALTMTAGLEWDESLPYSDPRNSEIAMELAPDRLRFALDRPVAHPPGEVWTYSGGATALIGAVIARGVGMELDAYAQARLFAPLGIEDWAWTRGFDGAPSAASGLRMSARGLARLARMLLAQGRGPDGGQLVPAAWIEQSFRPRIATGPEAFDPGYGYFWWTAPGEAPVWAAGFGNGGQRLSINRGLDLAMIVLAGNYNRPDAWTLPVAISRDFLGPALEGR